MDTRTATTGGEPVAQPRAILTFGIRDEVHRVTLTLEAEDWTRTVHYTGMQYRVDRVSIHASKHTSTAPWQVTGVQMITTTADPLTIRIEEEFSGHGLHQVPAEVCAAAAGYLGPGTLWDTEPGR